MSETSKCAACSCQFDIQKRIQVALSCRHQVCKICVLEQQRENGSYQCPKRQCKKVSFVDPQSLLSQKDQTIARTKEQKQLNSEESKNKVPLQQKAKKRAKQLNVKIITSNKEQINLTIEEGKSIEQLKQKIEQLEGIDPDFYELY